MPLVNEMVGLNAKSLTGIGWFAGFVNINHHTLWLKLRKNRPFRCGWYILHRMKNTIRINTDRGATHTTGAYRYRNTFVSTCKIKGICVSGSRVFTSSSIISAICLALNGVSWHQTILLFLLLCSNMSSHSLKISGEDKSIRLKRSTKMRSNRICNSWPFDTADLK